MRISGALFLTILIAVGYMMYLTGRNATSSLDAVAAVATDLREVGVTGRALDRDLALQMIGAMEGLLAMPDTLPDHIEDLKTFAATAARSDSFWHRRDIGATTAPPRLRRRAVICTTPTGTTENNLGWRRPRRGPIGCP